MPELFAPPIGKRLLPAVMLPLGRFPWWFALLGLAWFGVVFVGLGALYVFVLVPQGLYIGHWLTVLQDALLALGCLCLAHGLAGPRLATDFPLLRRCWGWQAGVGLALQAAMQVLVYGFEAAVPGAREAAQQMAQSLDMGRSVGLDVAVTLAVTVGAALGEELVFRGVIYRALRDGLARWLPVQASMPVALLVSSGLFGVVHISPGQNVQLPMLCVMGALMALAYEWSGSLWVPMLLHSVNNTLSLLQIMAGLPQVQVSAPWIYGLAACGPLLTGVLGWALLSRPAPQSAGPARQPASSR